MEQARVRIEEETLRRMYVEERRTTDAQRLACSGNTIRRRLRGLSIPVRARGPYPERYSRHVGRVAPGWSRNVAYAVGVIATDGNLSPDKRHLAISAKDAAYLAVLRDCLGLRNSIGAYWSGNGNKCHKLQWSDRRFYDWLVTIGLTPAKSLTLGPLAVPDEYFADFFRGCIDGDGSVLVYTDRYHVPKNDRYVYERLYVSLVSASPAFLDWIRGTVHRLLGVGGSIAAKDQKPHPLFVLRYAKRESLQVLRWIYDSPDVPCLRRKWLEAEPFVTDPRRSIISSRGRRLKYRRAAAPERCETSLDPSHRCTTIY